MAEPARELGPPFPALGVQQIGAPLLDGDARGLEAVGRMRGELFFDGWIPAELCKQRITPLRTCRKAAEGRRDTDGQDALPSGLAQRALRRRRSASGVFVICATSWSRRASETEL